MTPGLRSCKEYGLPGLRSCKKYGLPGLRSCKKYGLPGLRPSLWDVDAEMAEISGVLKKTERVGGAGTKKNR
jgi:hypothetical protein